MANRTKKLILQTFTEMLETTPFDRISVSALTRRCEISHNTFYYHYRDIYDLLDAWLETELDRPLAKAQQAGAKEFLRDLLQCCKERRKTVYHLFDCLSRNQLERYLFTRSDRIVLPYIRELASGKDLPEERLVMLAGFCRYSLMGFFIEYLWNSMSEDPAALAERVYGVLSSFIRAEIEVP